MRRSSAPTRPGQPAIGDLEAQVRRFLPHRERAHASLPEEHPLDQPQAAAEAVLAELRLHLPARAERIAYVRACMRSLGEALSLEEQSIADIGLAVTEACTNVVLHAYPGDRREGPLCLHARATRRARGGIELAVSIRDSGRGLRPGEARAPDRSERTGLGVGIRLMRALAKNVSLRSDEAGATEVLMTFLPRERMIARGVL
jgi:serine/threonine-protein kinase RsbW